MDLEVMATKLSGDPEQDIKTLSNHVFQLEENLRYMLRNLDVTNFNDLGLARYENGRLQVYAKEVSLQTDKLRVEFGKETEEIYAQISATAEELLAEIEDVNGNYSSLSQTVSGIQSTVQSHTGSISSLQSQITQTSNKISAVVSAVDDSSGNVTAASIVAAINATSGSSMVQIKADHIKMTGTTTFISASDLSTAGKTVINGANIETGTISADAIYGGTLNGVRIESYGLPPWADPLGGEQAVVIEDGGLDITGTRFYDALWSFNMDCLRGVFRINLYDGSYYEFAGSGIYLNGMQIA